MFGLLVTKKGVARILLDFIAVVRDQLKRSYHWSLNIDVIDENPLIFR